MGELYAIAQRHMDAYGIRAAALARRMGTSAQTLDAWKNRGVKALPARRHLEALARETRTPYGDVLTAALRDAGYLPKQVMGNVQHPAPIDDGPATAQGTSFDAEPPPGASSPPGGLTPGQDRPG